MGKKKDVVRGAFGRSEGYSVNEEEADILEQALTEGMDPRVEPAPIEFGGPPEQGLPQPDAYNIMAQRLEESMGPSEAYQPGILGGIQEYASGLGDAAIASDTVRKQQETAALELAKLRAKGAGTLPKRPKITWRAFEAMGKELSRLETNREATGRLRRWAMSREQSTIKKKLGMLEGLAKKAEFWIKGPTHTMTPKEAIALSDYWDYVNSEIKRITGAQMSEPEARRLMKQMPKLYDQPKAFMGVWDKIMKNNERAVLTQVGNYKRGNWEYLEGLLPQYEKLAATPYQDTVWPEKSKQAPPSKRPTSKKPAKKSSRRSALSKEKEALYEKYPNLRPKGKKSK